MKWVKYKETVFDLEKVCSIRYLKTSDAIDADDYHLYMGMDSDDVISLAYNVTKQQAGEIIREIFKCCNISDFTFDLMGEL